MHSILNDSSSSDLTLVCQDGEVQVHRCIMAGRSPVFKSLMESDMMEKKSGRVMIEDFKIKVVRALVLYIYTAKIEDGFDDIATLMKIGNKYLIETLVEDCSKKLIKLITVSNVLELGAVAEVYSVQDLMESCAQFVSRNLDVLEKDWKEKLQSSPQFLMSIVEFMKSEMKAVEVFRFGWVDQSTWDCMGDEVDAISFKLSHAATLTSIGLFGTKNTDSIPVRISVTDGKCEIFSSSTSYKSTGTEEPIRVPVCVKMEADTKYTVSVVIGASLAYDLTHCGNEGRSVVNCGGKLKVMFMDSSDSANGTTVLSGQIPSLGFQI